MFNFKRKEYLDRFFDSFLIPFIFRNNYIETTGKLEHAKLNTEELDNKK